MPVKLYYSLVIILCLFAGVLIATGGFTIQIGGMSLSAHRINSPVILIIILTTVQFFISGDFRRSIIRCLEKLVDNKRYFLALILSLFLVEFLLGLLYFIFYGQKVVFDLDSELSVSNYFSSFLLVFTGLIIGVIYQFERKSLRSHKGWWFIGFIFWYLSLDEVGRLHEGVLPFLERHASSLGLGQSAVKTWVLALSPFILFTVVYFSIFFFKKLRHYLWILTGLIIGLLLWILSIRLELWKDSSGPFYQYEVLVEELSEMIGSTLFLASFLGYFRIIKSRKRGQATPPLHVSQANKRGRKSKY